MKKRILIIDTGGTISQKPDKQGIYRPSKEPFLRPQDPLRRKLESIAHIDCEPLERIDSSIIELSYRCQIGKIIATKATDYDGFVIIHGTDTMAESAACLSYMLQGLGKPVVLTGAQLSYFETTRASDAEHNIFGAVQCAIEDFGEVLIFFGNHAIRGTRAYKEDSFTFNAFSSSSQPPLAHAGISLYLYEHRTPRPTQERHQQCHYFEHFNPNVAFFTPISGAHDQIILESLAHNPQIEAILLTGFGSGNLGARYLKGIEQCLTHAKPVCIVSNCIAGPQQQSMYSAGEHLRRVGACHVQGITSIAAGQKIMYALGLAQHQAGQAGQAGQANLVQSVYETMRRPISGDIL